MTQSDTIRTLRAALQPFTVSKEYANRIVDATGRPIFDLNILTDSKTECDALFKFVMDACNAHAELLAALKDCLNVAERFYRRLPDDSAEQDAMMQEVIGPARAAIRKAEGG